MIPALRPTGLLARRCLSSSCQSTQSSTKRALSYRDFLLIKSGSALIAEQDLKLDVQREVVVSWRFRRKRA
jgi:hypothetical protein